MSPTVAPIGRTYAIKSLALAILGIVTHTALAAPSLAQTPFVNFESGQTSPMSLSPDGSRLFVADTVGGRLSVFSLTQPSQPRLVAEIPVGLDPVSVRARTDNEVWVCCQLSDSVNIVDIDLGLVVETIQVGDEPSDIVFAGGFAFVTTATLNEVQAVNLTTRAVTPIPVFGKDPRSLAVSSDGSRVYAVIQRSGNGTTIISESVAPPQHEITPGVPDPFLAGFPITPQSYIDADGETIFVPVPPVSRIVRANDPLYTSGQLPAINYTLPDNDVVEIDVATLSVLRNFTGVGTTNTGIAVHPISGDLWIPNTEARNIIRFEPQLRGHAIDSRVTRITTGTAPQVTVFDLNPTITFQGQFPDFAAQAVALAEPYGIVFNTAGSRAYVAAQGTDRIGVLDASGNVIARIDVSEGATTRNKRGPRALALSPTGAFLYVFNRVSDTISVVDTANLTLIANSNQKIATVDAMPAATRQARGFLYDAKLSGNFTFSCAACHIDGDTDGLAWDLGDPQGSIVLTQDGELPRHPMKGPMTTQTLRGLDGVGPLHWRGDKENFEAFNGAFDKLMGGAMIAAQDMTDFADFGRSMRLPPNPNQRLDRNPETIDGLLNPPVGTQVNLGWTNNELHGLVDFLNANGPSGLNCVTCHALETGTNGSIQTAGQSQSTQPFKVAHLRNLYRKEVASNIMSERDSGFGLGHDGFFDRILTISESNPPIPSVTGFLNRIAFTSSGSAWTVDIMDDIQSYLNSFDTGTAPFVGRQFVMNQTNAASVEALVAPWLLLATPEDFEMIAYGSISGRKTGFLYNRTTQLFDSDRSGVGPFSLTDLRNLVATASSGNRLTFLAVTPGTGQRIALDRDLDTTLNGAEDADPFPVGTPGCSVITLDANSVPAVGNTQFALVIGGTQANTVGVMVTGPAVTSLSVLGITLLIDPTSSTSSSILCDANGRSVFPIPIAQSPALAGSRLFGQAIVFDTCGSHSWASSAGIDFTVQP